MMRLLTLLAGWVGLALVAVPRSAQAADAANGEVLAKRWCAACHVVAADQQRANADAPSFVAIAAMADFNAARVAFFLLEPHPKMPNMSLSRRETEDIAAYIATLRR
jgi:mono/diheme cytochrome c family protein